MASDIFCDAPGSGAVNELAGFQHQPDAPALAGLAKELEAAGHETAPADQAVGGVVTRDWVRPQVTPQ